MTGWYSAKAGYLGKGSQGKSPLPLLRLLILPFNCAKYSLCKKYKNVVICKCAMRSKRRDAEQRSQSQVAELFVPIKTVCQRASKSDFESAGRQPLARVQTGTSSKSNCRHDGPSSLHPSQPT